MTSKPAREQSSAAFINQATIEIEAPAKLNLFLRISGKRANGYHEIESLFVPVALYDNLKISIIEEGIEASCSGRKLPEGQNNLVNRAALSFFEETRISKGAKISLIKRIPISSGLGGGSSDAAATLRGLNTLWGNPLSKRDLKARPFFGRRCSIFSLTEASGSQWDWRNTRANKELSGFVVCYCESESDGLYGVGLQEGQIGVDSWSESEYNKFS